MEKFSKRLKELRLREGLSQEELSKAVSISVYNLNRWEHNLSEPKIKDLVSLAQFFSVTINYLLCFGDK